METLGSHEAVEVYWNAVAPHLQAKFCHESLGTKIKIERFGELKYVEKAEELNNVQKAEEFVGSADLYALMIGGWGGGVAWGLVCSPGAGSATHYQTSTAYFARVSPFK